MKVCGRRFNIYFTLAAALVLVCGCKTDKQKDKVSALRVHLEAVSSDPAITQTISVLRSEPVTVTIARDPILTEANALFARIVAAPGGFAIQVQFDESSGLMLEQFSAANPGRHLVIFGQWDEKLEDGRWLAAPLITHRIANGLLAFTPDISREDADRLVLGLNNVSAKIHKGLFK